MARALGVSATLVAKIRDKRRWLPKRQKVKPGSRGRTGTPRYRFVDAVAAEVARISAEEFRLAPKTIRSVIRVIGSGDADAVSRCEVVVSEGPTPGTVRHTFLGPTKGAARRSDYFVGEDGERFKVLSRVSLMEIVLAVANRLHERVTMIDVANARSHKRSTRGNVRRKW